MHWTAWLSWNYRQWPVCWPIVPYPEQQLGYFIVRMDKITSQTYKISRTISWDIGAFPRLKQRYCLRKSLKSMKFSFWWSLKRLTFLYQRMQCASSFCTKEANVEFSCAALYRSYRTGLEMCVWWECFMRALHLDEDGEIYESLVPNAIAIVSGNEYFVGMKICVSSFFMRIDFCQFWRFFVNGRFE